MSPVQPYEWNRTRVDYPRNSMIGELFVQQAALTPHATALIAKERRLSYRQLDELSNRVARRLQALGVKPETLVGVSIERSASLIICLLGVLKAGGAYVPLDPNHPTERLSLVIEDSGMRVIITSSAVCGRLPLKPSLLTILDADDAASPRENDQVLHSAATCHNLAYVIYTSGTTGNPKGVMVEHRNVVNFFTGMDRTIGVIPGVWLAVTSFAFDISVLELLWTLTRGFTVVLHGDEGAGTIADEMIRYEITHLQMTPSLARMLTLNEHAFSALGSLRQILLGGEALPASLVHRIRQSFKGELFNMYGPTEATIWSTTYRVQEPGATVPIGRPIANTEIYLLDSDRHPVSPGQAGEMFIGGDGVARGYWNRPDLTADRFVALSSSSAQRLYRTGDLARFLSDGNIEFLGRADFQVKLRGHRIEPGEIETLLEQLPGIRQAVILLREDKEGDPRLVAYVVGEDSGPETVHELKKALGVKLPEAMIPSAFVFLPSMPLTENGKLDRKALLNLPPPIPTAASSISQVQPNLKNEIEIVVAQAWQEALGISSVGLNDNFFDLGAHSLTIAEVQAKLQNALECEISLVDLFHFSTVSLLSRHLAGITESGYTSDRAQRRKRARQR